MDGGPVFGMVRSPNGETASGSRAILKAWEKEHVIPSFGRVAKIFSHMMDHIMPIAFLTYVIWLMLWNYEFDFSIFFWECHHPN